MSSGFGIPFVGLVNFKTSEGVILGKDLGDLGDRAMFPAANLFSTLLSLSLVSPISSYFRARRQAAELG